MEELRAYLATLNPAEQAAYADRSGTTIGYLRKMLSTGGRLGEAIVIGLERESGAKVTCEGLRPDVDWSYLRGTEKRA
jgi:DNA-binding transcriptional regulator YdaS (Cro superfamily)